jgi:hypothetical protein
MGSSSQPASRRLPRHRAWAASWCLGAVLITTACGSTVALPPGAQGAGANNPAADLGSGLTPESTPRAVTQSPGQGGTAPGDDGSQPSGSDAGSATSAPSGPQTSTAGAGPTRNSSGPSGTARGITSTSIKIGAITVQGANDFIGSAGFSFDTGDQAAMTRAIAAHLNASGGIAGRKINVVFHDIPVNDLLANPSSAYQAACSDFTEDQGIYAMSSVLGTFGDTLYACLSRQRVISVTNDPRSARFFTTYSDYFYAPNEVNVTRMWRSLVPALQRAGYFGSKAKIGLLRQDTPDDKSAADEGLRPALAQLGLKVDSDIAFSPDSNSSAQYSSAVLKLKAAGITHVLTSPLSSALLFMPQAESQGYRPRYGLQSRNSPGALAANVPASQLKSAIGVGWQPMQDVDNAHDPGPVSARQTECTKVLKSTGQDVSVRTTLLVGLAICDNFLLLRDVLAGAKTFAARDVSAAARSLTSYTSAFTFRGGLRPGGLNDLAQAYRLFTFASGCSCFTYTSTIQAFP